MLYETDRTTTLVLVPHGLQPRLLRILCTLYLWRALLYVWYACGYRVLYAASGGPRSARGTRTEV